MVSRHGIQLAAHIISCFYGDLCSKVCECLLRRGTLSLAQIVRFTEMNKENVVNCLRILIHQNCIQAFAIQQEGAFGEAPRILTQYIALFDNMIHRLRAPKFLQIVSEELGKDCLEIFQGMIEHGRISVDQIIDGSEGIARRNKASFDVHGVRENFSRLLNARFIERCPAPEPFLAPPSEEDTPAKKRGAKSAKIAEQTIEQRALAAAAPMESMRFLMEMDDLTEEKEDESLNSVTAGKKRKHNVLKCDEEVLLDANRKKEVLWRVNFEELVYRLRHKACISYMKTRTSDEAIIVLSAMLDLSRRENRPKAENSASVSINAIYDEVIKKEGGLGMDFERVRTSLEQLGCEISSDIDESYSIDIKGIIEMARKEEVESMVSKRYGREAFKIFRLLSKDGHFHQTDKIADSTFVEKKDAIKILYKLWNDEYVQMEGDGVRQSLMLPWRVDRQLVHEQFLDELFHAALNLRLRFAYEKEQGKEILQLPKEKLVKDLKRKYELAQKVRIVLESSFMNLDDVVLLFHDF